MTVPPLNAIESAGARPVLAASAVRTFERTATFMPMKPVSAESTAPIRKPIATFQPRSDVHDAGDADQQEHDDGHAGDGRVLALEVGGGALLDGGGDLPHPLGTGGLAEHPAGQGEAVDDRERAADEGDQHSMASERTHVVDSLGTTKDE